VRRTCDQVLSSAQVNDQFFLVGQKAFIRNDRNELLLLFDEFGIDLPGGKIQQGETDVIASLKREVFEETQLDIEPSHVFHTWMLTLKHYGEQKNILLYLVGYISKLKSGSVMLSNEHTDYKWLSKAEFAKLSANGSNYEAVAHYFTLSSDD
jgi:8-oxo-dGTP pyrophosphatase MutT (NUDIX family)